MNSHAPDPYARQRSLWSRWRHYARWVVWWFEVAAFFGLLEKPGLWSRCLARELGRLEHGLRCLLIIGAQKVRCVTPPTGLTPPQPSPSRGGSDLWRGYVPGQDSLPLVGRVGVGGFSFSLKAFDQPQNTDTTSLRNAPKRPLAPPMRSVELDLTTRRRHAMLDVFENSAAYTAEMARRLAQRGIKAEASADAKTIWC